MCATYFPLTVSTYLFDCPFCSFPVYAGPPAGTPCSSLKGEFNPASPTMPSTYPSQYRRIPSPYMFFTVSTYPPSPFTIVCVCVHAGRMPSLKGKLIPAPPQCHLLILHSIYLSRFLSFAVYAGAAGHALLLVEGEAAPVMHSPYHRRILYTIDISPLPFRLV